MADKQPGRGGALNDGMANDTWQKRRKQDVDRLNAGFAESPVGRGLAGMGAAFANEPIGVARGAWRNAKGLWDGVNFGVRLIDPTDPIYSPEGEAGWDKVADAGAQAYLYGRNAVSHPETVLRDLGNGLGDYFKANYLWASPVAPTMAAEIDRGAGIGRNRGEQKVDSALLLEGGLGLKGLTGFGKIPPLPDSAYLAAGVTQRQLARLDELYTRPGHHVVRQKWTKEWPQWIRDNPAFVVSPPGISKREMYELHFGLDNDFKGGRLPKDRRGPGGFSGEKIGMKRYGAVDRLAFGTPFPLQVMGTTGGIAPILKPFTFGASDERPANVGGLPQRYSR